MSTEREIRPDQHGTMTGYTYGCRNECCRKARRAVVADHEVGSDTLDRIFDALLVEADLDGLVTATGARIGELVGVSSVSATRGVHMLAEQGRVRIIGAVGVGGVLAVQMDDVA